MKNFLLSLLVVIIIGISIYVNKEESDAKKQQNDVNVGQVNIDNMKETDYIDIKDSLSNYDKDIDLSLKHINYPIMKFFRSVNKKDYSDIEVFPEYANFFLLSNEFLKNKYNDFNNVFYEIVSFTKSDHKYLIDVNLIENGSDKVIKSTLSTDGVYIMDEPFLKIQNINNVTETEKYLVNVEAKAVYTDKEVYKIRVKNKSEDYLSIDHGMYGFYAIRGTNKYYHKLLNNSSDYEILPHSENVYFVEFLGRNKENIFIIIENEDILITVL